MVKTNVLVVLARTAQTRAWQALALALLISGVSFAFQRRLGFDFSDEGYLWYGVQRVLAGEVPIRDFQAYDPGRYYFSAALMALLGDDGLVALRATLALAQGIGLFIGLRLVAGALPGRGWGYLLASAGVLAAWMFSSYKLYDITASIALVAALTLLVRATSRKEFFMAGLVVGLAAVVGRNHGVYGVLGSGAVLAYTTLAWDRQRLRLRWSAGPAYWASGVAVGYLPVLLMLWLVPGFAPAFAESVRFLFEIGATNLPLPVPWPWRVAYSGLPVAEASRQVFLGMMFVALPVCSLVAIGWVLLRKVQGRVVPPAGVAAACLAPFYVHYAFSRADIYHLAFGIFPLLLGLLVLLAGSRWRGKWPLLLALLAGSVWITYDRHAINEACVRHAFGENCEPMMIGKDQIMVKTASVQKFRMIQRYAEATPRDRNILVAPLYPGAYPVLGKTSPIWEIYALFPRSEAFQRAEIERLKKARPGLLVIVNYPTDGRPELMFSNTHPLMTRYIHENYRLVASLGEYYFFRPPELVAEVKAGDGEKDAR